MTQRVIIVLDVTMNEADAIAERIAGVGPYYEGWSLPILLDEIKEMNLTSEKIPHCAIRSEASSALGGPDTPDFVKRDS